MKRKRSNPDSNFSRRKLTEDEFAAKFKKLSEDEQEWIKSMLIYDRLFSEYNRQYIYNQANILHLTGKIDYEKLKNVALNQEERDYSEDELTDDSVEKNYIIALDKMITAADQLLDECLKAYQGLLQKEEESRKNRKTRGYAKAKKILMLSSVFPDHRSADLMELTLDKWAELIGQISVYLVTLRQKRAVLEALRDNPENPDNEDPEEGLTPTQLFQGAY